MPTCGRPCRQGMQVGSLASLEFENDDVIYAVCKQYPQNVCAPPALVLTAIKVSIKLWSLNTYNNKKSFFFVFFFPMHKTWTICISTDTHATWELQMLGKLLVLSNMHISRCNMPVLSLVQGTPIRFQFPFWVRRSVRPTYIIIIPLVCGQNESAAVLSGGGRVDTLFSCLNHEIRCWVHCIINSKYSVQISI